MAIFNSYFDITRGYIILPRVILKSQCLMVKPQTVYPLFSRDIPYPQCLMLATQDLSILL